MLTSWPIFNFKDFSGPRKALITGVRSSAYLVIGPALTMVCFSVPFLNVIPLVFIKPENGKNDYEQKTILIGECQHNKINYCVSHCMHNAVDEIRKMFTYYSHK